MLDRLWNLPVPTGEDRYYAGTMYAFAMLHLAGLRFLTENWD